MYKIKITVIVSAASQALALVKLQDRIEPKDKHRSENEMYVDSVDKIEEHK